MARKLEDFHLRWLELAGVEVDRAIPDEVIFSLYEPYLNYGPYGEEVNAAFAALKSRINAASPKMPVATIFKQEPLLNAVYFLGKTENTDDYSSEDYYKTVLLCEDDRGYNKLWTELSILGGRLSFNRPGYDAEDMDYCVTFSRGVLLFFWGLGGLGENAKTLPKYEAVVTELSEEGKGHK